MIENSEFNQVAQLSHFGGAAAIIYGSIVLFGGISAMWPAFFILLIISGVKEFWYDYHYETTDVRGSSLEDFLFYMAGAAFAIGSVYIKTLLF